MKALTPFPNEDLKLIKWQITCAVASILIATGIYMGANTLDNQAAIQLTNAQAEFQRARTSVESIEEEESTIIEYIGRYQELSAEGIVNPEDRLQFLETVAEIRAENSLFPIALSIDGQNTTRLRYDSAVREPGGPIDLHSSLIELELPLLHEQDLGRLLRGIMASPGLYQARKCEIILRSEVGSSFYVLAQHFFASCEMLWYTFDVNPPVEQQSGFF